MTGARMKARNLVAALVLLALPALLVPSGLGAEWAWRADQRTLSLATYASIYSVLAYGLFLLTRFVGLASVVHGALWGIGSYATAILAEQAGWSFWAILPVAALLPTVVAVALGLFSLRTHGLTFMIVTLALCEFFVLLATNWDSLTAGPLGIMVFKVPEPLGPLTFDAPLSRYYLALAFLYLAMALAWWIGRSAFGRRLEAIRDSELLARSLGLDAQRYKLAIFAISAAVVGLAGVPYVYHQQAIQPSLFGALPFIDVLLMVVIGGANILGGPAVGAWLVQFLPELLHPLGVRDANLHRLAYGVLLIVFVVLAPQGIAGLLKRGWDRLMQGPADAAPEAGAPLVAVMPAGSRAAVRPPLGDEVLQVTQLQKSFRGVRAVDGVSFSLRRGEVLGVIGPNGSGKTTLFNCLSGHLGPDGGRVLLRGTDITDKSMDAIARQGLVRTFQHPLSFHSKTVAGSLELALGVSAGRARSEAAAAGIPDQAGALLAFCGIGDVAQRPVTALSYGHSRLLGVALALAARPAVLMLDEPAAGLNHVESAALAALLARVRDAGVTLMVIDHDMAFLLPLCDRLLVLDAGALIAQGPPEAVRRDARVAAVYLGGALEGKKTAVARPAGGEFAGAEQGLQIRELVVAYGPVTAVRGLTIRVQPGEAVAVLGANGAGKTTTLRAVSGLLRPRSGQILWQGQDLVGRSPADILRRGIAHVPEGRMVFAQQTVEENLRLGQRLRQDKAAAQADMERLLERLPALKPRLREPAGNLSGGQQQMLVIARGLLSDPSLLILDEPSLGLSPRLVEEVVELVEQLRSEKTLALLLVEQNPAMAARLTDRVYVMQNGVLRSELASSAVSGNVDLLDAYLGGPLEPAEASL
jgi:branched-chain amino acid transport system ATP-binding protein